MKKRTTKDKIRKALSNPEVVDKVFKIQSDPKLKFFEDMMKEFGFTVRTVTVDIPGKPVKSKKPRNPGSLA